MLWLLLLLVGVLLLLVVVVVMVVMVVVVRNPMLLQCKGRYDQTNGHRPSRPAHGESQSNPEIMFQVMELKEKASEEY